MRDTSFLGALAAALFVLCCCMAPAWAQEQICIRVSGPLFSVSYHDLGHVNDPGNGQYYPLGDDPGNETGGWICQRVADPDAPPTNVIGMNGFLLDVGFLKSNVAGGDLCFVDQRCIGDPPYTVCDYDLHGHLDVMTGGLQIYNKKNQPIEMVHWERGLTTVNEEILYMVQYVGETDDRVGDLPPTLSDYVSRKFDTLLVETEGRGKLGKTACKDEFLLAQPAQLEIARCAEQEPNPHETNGYIDENGELVPRPLPCPGTY